MIVLVLLEDRKGRLASWFAQLVVSDSVGSLFGSKQG